MSRNVDALKRALTSLAGTVSDMKEAGYDDLADGLRSCMSKIRRELNHVEAVKDHPDLFG